MKHPWLPVSAAAALALAAQPAQATVMFTAAYVNTAASAFGTSGHFSGTGGGTGDAMTTLLATPIDATASATQTTLMPAARRGQPPVQLASSSNFADAYAIFNTPGSGMIEFSGTSAATLAAAALANDPASSAVAYEYSQFAGYFTTTTAATLTLNYTTQDSGVNAAFGQQLYIFNKTTNLALSAVTLPENRSGTLTVNLTPGDYLFEIYDNYSHDYLLQNTPGSSTATRDDVYHFAIAAVPEPASWALFVLGLGGAGLVLRRRREGAIRPA